MSSDWKAGGGFSMGAGGRASHRRTGLLFVIQVLNRDCIPRGRHELLEGGRVICTDLLFATAFLNLNCGAPGCRHELLEGGRGIQHGGGPASHRCTGLLFVIQVSNRDCIPGGGHEILEGGRGLQHGSGPGSGGWAPQLPTCGHLVITPAVPDRAHSAALRRRGKGQIISSCLPAPPYRG